MLVQSTVAGDSRVLRQAATLTGSGHDVHVVGRSVPPSFEPAAGVTVHSVAKPHGIRPAGVDVARATSPDRAARASSTGRGSVQGGSPLAAVRRAGVRAGRWLLLPEHRDRTERQWRAGADAALADARPFDVVHAHDFNTLELGVALARRWNAALVYDTHELWFDRGLPGRPTPLKAIRGRRHETQLARSATVVLTVSEGIAQRLRERGLADVRVVHNTFPMAGVAEPQLPGRPTGIVYAGRIGAGRDLETVVAAATSVVPLRTVLAGPADRAFHLDTAAVELLPSMPLDRVDRLYQDLGIAVVTLTDTCDNHRLALPNKLFHAVRAGVPVVAADLPEMAAVVTEHRLGALYHPGDSTSLARAVAAVVTDYPAYAAGVRAARGALAWENDAKVLVDVYDGMSRR